MKFASGLLFAILLSVSAALAVEPVRHTVMVPAWPLQVFNAFTVDWQFKQWTGAQGVFTDPRPGGAWRLKLDDHVEAGLYDSLRRPDRIIFDLLFDSTLTHVVLDLKRVNDSTQINLRHSVPDNHPELRDSVDAYWTKRLPQLTDYLTNLPGGYAAVPRGSGPFPTVFMVHDRFGLNRMVRMRCDSLAALGYVAITSDMFRGEVTGDKIQAEKFLQAVDEAEALTAARRGMAYLKQRADVDKNKVEVWGLGWGGKIALTLATEEPRLKGCVVWRDPATPSPELLNRIACPVLGMFGDVNVDQPRADIKQFNLALTQAGIRVETVILPGIRDFGDPAYGEGYSQPATQQALQQTFQFLDKQLR
jgi:carboxymethylenebutenolidase